LSSEIDQKDSPDTFRPFHKIAAKCTFFSRKEHSFVEITYQVTKQAIVNLRRLKSCEVYFPGTVK
jgi:hypothetical protein